METNNEMITREQYLEALELIDNYHRQVDKQQTEQEVVETQIEPKVEKTTIEEWVKRNLGVISARLKNSLLQEYCDNRECNLPPIYIEDIDKNKFLSFRNLGVKTWIEFSELRKIETLLNI
jgi:hypothetical protein